MTTLMMRSTAVVAVIAISCAGLAGAHPASADPAGPAGPDVQPVVAADTAPPVDGAPVEGVPGEGAPVDDGKVASNPPVTDKSPDGWTMTVGGKDETQRAVPPLTTAISTREYQVGCGIEMTTGNGVVVSGNASGTAGVGIGVTPGLVLGDFYLPSAGVTIGGGVAVSLKPGLINIVPVTKKNFVGTTPWVSIDNFRVKIDGCVGQSFIRSYATLAKSSEDGDAILSWYGVTKSV